jgi:fumarate reductase iron-sulfur subunit
LQRRGRPDGISAIRKQMQTILEEAAGIYRDGDTLTKAADKLRELRNARRPRPIDDASRRFNTERVAGLELTGMLELAECIVHSALRREESRGAHQRTDFPDATTTEFLAHSLVHREPDGSPRVSLPAGAPSPAGHPANGSTGGERGRQITLRVARYRPRGGPATAFADYDVPLRTDWAVLDGLNYIKDELDGTLSYRWSCRMGICGSCGMMINGEPKLTCATFLIDLAPGPVRIEPLANFPVIRDLVVDITDFMHKLGDVKPWLIRDRDNRSRRGSTCRRRPNSPTSSSSACASTACSATRRVPCTGWTLVRRPRGDRPGPAVQPGLPGRGRPRAADDPGAAEGVWDCTFVGECSRRCPKGVDPAGRDPAGEAAAAQES